MFKKNKTKPELTLGDMPSRILGLIMDSQIQNGHEMAVLLGGAPMSEELREREEEESDKRLERIDYLVPLVYAHAHLLTEGAVEYQRNALKEELKGVPDELWRESRKMMEQVALSAVMGSVSQLVDMGFLEVPRKYKDKK